MLGWLLCVAMLLAVLPSNLFTAEAAETVHEVRVTMDKAPIYSKTDPAEKNIVGYAEVNTVFQLADPYGVQNRDIPRDEDTKDFYEFYKVYYEANGKTEKGYILCKHLAYYYKVGNPKLDKTGIPDKMGVTDIYFSQGDLDLKYVDPNIQVIGEAEMKVAEVEINVVSPYTVIQGQRVAAKYFPDWNIKNLKALYNLQVPSTVAQKFKFMSEKNAYLKKFSSTKLSVVAYNDKEVIFWSNGYRSFTADSLLQDCQQKEIQMTHPAGFYSIPLTAVNLTLYK